MLFGGYIAEIPTPHHRKFDDKRRRRKVRFAITVFSGIGGHYYTSLVEEDNPIWDVATDKFHDGAIGWHKAWDDKGAEGRHLSTCLKTVRAAQKWVRDTFQREFGSKTHKLVREHTNYAPKWCYKDGD